MSLLWPLLFCIFIIDLLDVVKFRDPFIVADKLKTLAISKTNDEVQRELTEFQNWVDENDMQLAIDKCAQTKIRGNLNNLILNGITFEQKTSIKDR